MRSVSASDAKQNFAATLDAAQREPVVICRHQREVAVLLSMRDYEEMRQPGEGAPPASSQTPKQHAPLSMSEQLLAQLLADEEAGDSWR